ncbi:hypothetical protein Pogu_1651 [Pyrobaculum oguniense TE7]|uniref:Uncharacterized protein n=1 Tax=Pyrobaculum oguniense (strain DSM 13380 / JCM 10595 / TE7) TaxID=698757 RepID=H6QAQ2_PYROT|nr:hypothetical protein Pogu_1651 [Pyrobaculum oguniense TE7]
MPYYPVVPVKWIRERFERAKELAARRSIRNLQIYQPLSTPRIC